MAGFFFLGGPLPKLPPHEPAESITRPGFELLSWSQHAQCYNNVNSNITANKKLSCVAEGDEIGSFSLGVGPAALTNLGFDERLLTTVASTMRGGHSGMNCQDCGNQAKKDCQHMRCRMCCKSRGLPCETHVKSTWVSAAKRRERQEQLTAAMQTERAQVEEHQRFRIENPKRMRDHRRSNDSNNQLVLTVANHIIPTASTGFQVAEFPDELNSPALFRCVRVSSVDNSDEEYAYQTAVNIGGHVFKGILYDQGADNTNPMAGEASSAGGNATQPLNFITAAATNTVTATGAVAATNNPHVISTMMDPSLVYPAHFNAFMAGTQFFPPPRS